LPPERLKTPRLRGRPYVVIASIFERQIGRKLREYGYNRGVDFAVAPLRSYS
jgi:hypothetical protein